MNAKEKIIINPLADKSKPWGVIKFELEGKIHVYYTMINRLSGNRMSAYNSEAPYINSTMAEEKKEFKKIRELAKILDYQGTKHFE